MSKQDVYEAVLKPMRAVFSAPSHVARDDEALALEEYADALKTFDVRDLERGWSHVRNDHKRAWWPPIGLLVQACVSARRDRTANVEPIHGRMIDGKIQPWGGACQCSRCADKTPSPGFYRAPKEFAERAEAERKELDAWMGYKAEQAPKIRRGESIAEYLARMKHPEPKPGTSEHAEWAEVMDREIAKDAAE